MKEPNIQWIIDDLKTFRENIAIELRTEWMDEETVRSKQQKRFELHCAKSILEYNKTYGRFEKPTSEKLIEVALMFNEGIADQAKLTDMVSMAEFILDRLHEHGNLLHQSSKEITINSLTGKR